MQLSDPCDLRSDHTCKPGKCAIVGQDDYYKLREHKWFVSAGINNKFYAGRSGQKRNSKSRKTITEDYADYAD